MFAVPSRTTGYCARQWQVLADHGLASYAISTHLVGQATCDNIDQRHQSILPEHVWGDGDPEGVRTRAAQEMMDTARAARRFFDAAPEKVKQRLEQSGRTVVNGFTGSSIWHLLYSFPPVTPDQIEAGYADFARRWGPILDVFAKEKVHFALEGAPDGDRLRLGPRRVARCMRSGITPTSDSTSIPPTSVTRASTTWDSCASSASASSTCTSKDVWWSDGPMPIGVLRRALRLRLRTVVAGISDPRAAGRIDFEGVIRCLGHAGYVGPLTVEWEDPMMDREAGASEACAFVRKLDFAPSGTAFDAAFAN